MKKSMNRAVRRSSILSNAIARIENLEPRAYLTGVVFSAPVSTSAASAAIAPTFATLWDFNGDGRADLVVANGGSNTVSVLLSNSDGTFHQPGTQIAVGTSPLPLAIDKVNGDNNWDIVTGNTGTVSVALGNGDATFQSAQSFTALSHNDAIATADFNGDGRTDIVAVSDDTNATINDRITILFQNSNGSFTSFPIGGMTHTGLAAVAAADFNGDGTPDIAVLDQFDNKVTIILNNGNGTFAAPVDYNTGSGPTSLVAADFNGDGHTDLVTADHTGGAVSFLANSGTGTFAAPVNSAIPASPVGGGPLKVRLTNINGDSINDLIVLNGTGSTGDATVLLGNSVAGVGTGTFHVGTLINTGGGTRNSIATGDINGDGLTDAVVADVTNVSALLNVTNTDTTPPTAATPGSQPTAVLGATTYQFTVNYADNNQVDASSIGDTNLTVTGPGGFSQMPTLVSQNLGNGSAVSATYQLSFPSGIAVANNGTYTIDTNPDASGTVAVKDANGNPVAAEQIGTLSVNVTALDLHGVNFAVSGVTVNKLPPKVVAGVRGKTVNFTVTNIGDAVATKATLGFTLYASPTTSATDPGAFALATLTKKKVTLKIGKGKKYSFGKYFYPAGANGNYYLVVALTSTTVTESTATDDSGAIPTPTNIAPAFVDLANLWNGVLPATLPLAGKIARLTVALQNDGNVVAHGTVTATLTAISGDVSTPVPTFPLKVSIPVGKTRNFKVRLTVPTLAAGTYSVTLTITPAIGFTDTNSSNDTANSVNTFGILGPVIGL